MPGPVRQSSLIRQANISAAALTDASISGVVAGNTLIAIVFAHRPSSSAADIVTGYGTTIGGSPANTWTNIMRSKVLDSGGVWNLEITAWIASNVAAGTTLGRPTFAAGQDTALYVYTHLDEWSDIVNVSPVDRTIGGSSASGASSLTVGPTLTLAQTNEVVYAVIGTRLAFSWNGGSSGAGTPPSGYTILQGATDNSIAVTGQTSYKDPVGVTTAQSASWTYANAQTAVGAIFTLKQGTTNLRLEVDNIDVADITGTTGWTFWAWAGDPLDQRADKRWTAYSASIVSGKLVFPDAPTGAVAGNNFNVYGYQPSGTRTTGMMVGTVRAY